MNNKYQEIAVGDIGTQLFWFNKDNLVVSVTTGSFEVVVEDEDKYLNKIASATGTKTFTATVSTGTSWAISGGSTVTLSEYGIKTYGTVANNDVFTITHDGIGRFEYAVPVTAGAEFGGDVESFDAPETDSDRVYKVGGRTTLGDIPYTSNYTKEKYRRITRITDDTTLNTYMEVLSDGGAMIFKGTSGIPTLTAGDVRQINWTIIPQYEKYVFDIYNLDAEDKKGLDPNWYATDNGKDKIKIDLSSIPDYRPDYYAKENA